MSSEHVSTRGRFAIITLAALGVVYGDIGTSPLYALKEVFGGAHHPVPITIDNVYGILSLFFWSLVIVVTVKYVGFIMRANNKGEGGIMALMTLALQNGSDHPIQQKIIIALGLFGAALFYGDGVITPAISVLSSVEGLELITPAFKPYIIPITLMILILLFFFQQKGTTKVGAFFGPIMLVWFAVLAILGLRNILLHPSILLAINPQYAFGFLQHHALLGFFSLGAVVLCITGAEALYADMGHFGAKPIQCAWLGLVLPALVINYFGQGALLIDNAATIENPFYLLAPKWALAPLVILSSMATIIASQAVISGAFSITKQAIQLGYTPRFEVRHTSADEIGQIYLPAMNWILLLAIIGLVLGFGSSSRMAAAYGIAVTGTMLITNILAIFVSIRLWRWHPLRAVLGALPFVVIDLSFFLANSMKIADGGWFPLVFALVIFIVLTTWKRGREIMTQRRSADALPLLPFVDDLTQNAPVTVPGTAVYFTTNLQKVPHALLHSIKHYNVLHEHNIVLNVAVAEVPYVAEAQRVHVESLTPMFSRVAVNYGFKDEMDIPAALNLCAKDGLTIEPMNTSYFLGKETIIAESGSAMAYWRTLLFVALFRNASSSSAFFKIPSNRVVELGAQIVL